MDDGIQELPALDGDGTAVDLDVADRAVGKAVPEKENSLFFLHGPIHFQADIPGVQHVDVADPERFQLPGRVPVESDGRPVGIHDPSVFGIDDQHDGVVVPEKAFVQFLAIPEKRVGHLAIRRATLRGRDCGPFLRCGRLHRTLCRHKKPLTTESGVPLSTPAGSKTSLPGNSCKTSARQII